MTNQDVLISYQDQEDTFTFKVFFFLESFLKSEVCILGPQMFSERQKSRRYQVQHSPQPSFNPTACTSSSLSSSVPSPPVRPSFRFRPRDA